MLKYLFQPHSLSDRCKMIYISALELLSRAVSSVGVCSIPAVPTQGAIPEEGGY